MHNNKNIYDAIETAKLIVSDVKKKYKEICIDYNLWNSIEDDGYTEVQNVILFYDDTIDSAIETDIESIYVKYLKKNIDIPLYLVQDVGMLKNYKNPYFSRVFARTHKNEEIDINEVISQNIRKEIMKEVESLDFDRTTYKKSFKDFQQKYVLMYDPRKYRSYHTFIQAIQKKAQTIKNDNKDLVKSMKQFLNNAGIVLLVKDKKKAPSPIVDGLCGYVGKEKIPAIIIYKGDPKDWRRSFFTIAHELYHLFYNEGETSANTFAGSMLISQKDVEDVVIHTNKDIPKVLKKFYEKFGVSVECIVNTLFRYKKINKEQKQYYLTNIDKKKKMIEGWNIDIESEKKWIATSLDIAH